MPTIEEIEANADRQELLIARICKLMKWPYKQSPLWGHVRQIAHRNAVALSNDKLQEIIEHIERLENK